MKATGRDLLMRALALFDTIEQNKPNNVTDARDMLLLCLYQLREDDDAEWTTVREMNGLYQRIHNQRDSIKRLQAQVDVLRDVLKPFANFERAAGLPAGWGLACGSAELTPGHFQNAREAFEKPIDSAVFVGSGNVFRDLEVPDPECQQALCDVKATLATVRAERDVMYARAHYLRTYEPSQWREQVGYLLREKGIEIGLEGDGHAVATIGTLP